MTRFERRLLLTRCFKCAAGIKKGDRSPPGSKLLNGNQLILCRYPDVAPIALVVMAAGVVEALRAGDQIVMVWAFDLINFWIAKPHVNRDLVIHDVHSFKPLHGPLVFGCDPIERGDRVQGFNLNLTLPLAGSDHFHVRLLYTLDRLHQPFHPRVALLK